MNRCLQLAYLGAAHVAPNPMVGAVLVHGDTIIGEGYHQRYGEAHAEVNCFNSVSAENQSLISKSTLYVSLEPCADFGKTPPCVDLIIKYQVPHVVIACFDQFAEVNGKGIAKLRNAGIEVTENILMEEALELNKRFFTFHTRKQPWILLKWAQTSDGYVAGNNFEHLTISNAYTNRFTHQLRDIQTAIMVGFHTALHDNPSLTSRFGYKNHPVRIVIDAQLKLPATAAIFADSAPVIVLNRLHEKQEAHIYYAKVP
ncbi:MAG: bifunctional diaminohydroxyphosphoribosylaminopyrimidine deaminase/5-amino-6-(5-phosphoribosylamino)uracil reductase RibD, partial [Ferruginibacter sp.]